MGHDVFLSYSTRDKTAAEAVCAALERRGIAVWMAPRDIPPGSSYAASIVEAIDSARVLVLVFSAAANDSPDIEREVQRADAKRLKIVPFRIEDVEPKASLAYFPPSRQYLNAFTPPIEARYDELSEVVRRIAPPPSPRPSVASEVKPPPPPPQRSQRLFAILAGIVGLLVVFALAAWQWPSRTPGPQVVQPLPQCTEPKTGPRPELPPGPTGQASGDYGILFGSQKEGPNDPNGPLNEIRKARQIPNSPDPVLYNKNGEQWMSVVTFDSPEARKNHLRDFQVKFPAAKPAPIQLYVECPKPRVLAGKEGDIPEQIECVP
jgi:hypothetical protein